MKYEITDFDDVAGALAATGDIASLHALLLPHSPVVVMGTEFMQKFYYSVLIRDRLACGAVARVDGEPAGFVVATHLPSEFMRRAFVKHPIAAPYRMAMAILRRPSRARALWEAFQVQRGVEDREFGASVGEILSFGVRREFRSRAFVRDTGIRLSTDLLGRVCDRLKQRGMTSVRAVIDDDNLEAKMFYRSIGWELGSETPTGWGVPSCEFVKRLDPSAGAAGAASRRD